METIQWTHRLQRIEGGGGGTRDALGDQADQHQRQGGRKGHHGHDDGRTRVRKGCEDHRCRY